MFVFPGGVVVKCLRVFRGAGGWGMDEYDPVEAEKRRLERLAVAYAIGACVCFAAAGVVWALL